jgi:hypothetical protein
MCRSRRRTGRSSRISGRSYPAAQIIVALSPMITDTFPVGAMMRTKAAGRLQTIVAARTTAGDSKVSYFEFDDQNATPADGFGCDFHPSLTTNQKMSAKLVPVIRTLKSW